MFYPFVLQVKPQIEKYKYTLIYMSQVIADQDWIKNKNIMTE